MLRVSARSGSFFAGTRPVERRAGQRPLGRIAIAPEERRQAIVDGWPKQFVSAAATRLGLPSDADFEMIVADYLAGEGGDEARANTMRPAL
jgi:hypothetical protein